ncbi:hypothetical protein LM700876_150109 [Listeria monocytogenes]|nr:hypothetical protein LM700876_150109 [Listeria monocytogenes]CUL14397.1 hypothetical protein LM701337_90349 [Listeria monocytogenes]
MEGKEAESMSHLPEDGVSNGLRVDEYEHHLHGHVMLEL